MAWSKTTRIKVMLAIDFLFFVIELSVGFWVHSLALMADAFHMLNDIISLAVGLWAVSISKKATTVQYTYGWQRAEILGAFFNAVFLIALCVSIILEAVTRLLDPPEITNAQLILIVGSVGLASNIVGFFVLGGHGHSHGPEGHGHEEDGHEHDGHAHRRSDSTFLVEEGRAGYAVDENGPAVDILPEVAVARLTAGPPETPPRHITFDHESSRSDLERSASRASRGRRTPAGSRHSRFTSIDDISIHPASFRQDIMDACQPQPEDESSSDSSAEDSVTTPTEQMPGENAPLLSSQNSKVTYGAYGTRSTTQRGRRNSGIHDSHNHSKPKGSSGKSHGHSHGDMGMNAMILHVIGDALGNVGVIVTALIIWLTDWPGKFYADPAVSLFITLIILKSAIPLTITTSRVLLQATPNGIDAQQVKEDIESLPGVEACHDVHIWQLSDTTIVASMHVRVKFPVSDKNGEQFMELSRRARRCFHAYGIHSATIQPEFWTGSETGVLGDGALDQLDGAPPVAPSGDEVCLLECVENCTATSCCTMTKARPGSSRSGTASAHSEGADHGHDHH
ncbi:cation diffusion facilitator family transporter [Echria macrotheca]|uniref:Cation diffusion facilitator family transporter n=1 Tax=Echria macrotheca TaxID=438768 RepID=A0AAJ0BHQ6_9PEZI|nr:cation diffusion facilitator family transporter [Echria macrotheca]